jgi:hypothetical protein
VTAIRRSAAAALVLGVLFAVLIVTSFSRMHSSFGLSHDGFNASVWGSGSRALREIGPIDSRMGTRHLDGSTYANHPPGLVVEAAAVEAVLGERHWATRLPAALSSVAAVALVTWLATLLGAGPVAAAVGVTIAFGSPMFKAYWPMLDTPMVGLPFGVGVVALWRAASMRRLRRTWLLAPAAIGAILTSWLGVLTALGVVVAVAGRRRDRHLLPVTAAAVVAGMSILAAWLLWANGGLTPLVDALRLRTGSTEVRVPLAEVALDVGHDWHTLFPIWTLVLGLVGLAIGVRRRDHADTVALTVGVVVLWIVLFPMGAYFHDYWSYWLLVPLGLGSALAVDQLQRIVAQRWPATVLRAIPAVGVALAVIGLVAPSAPVDHINAHNQAGRVVEQARYPNDQHVAWYVAREPVDLPWLTYLTRRPTAAVTSISAATQLASSRPADLAFAIVRGRYRIVPARELPAIAKAKHLRP